MCLTQWQYFKFRSLTVIPMQESQQTLWDTDLLTAVQCTSHACNNQ